MDVFEIFSSIFMMLCSILGIICALIFIGVMAIEPQCRTMTISLALNSIIAGLFTNIVCFFQSYYQIVNESSDTLCPFRGFLLHAGTGALFHTLCVQATHRLFVTVYATKQYLQSTRLVIIIIVIQWLISSLSAFPTFVMGGIKYHIGSRICQVSMDDTVIWLYFGTVIYLVPLPMIVFIYIRIVKYMKNSPILFTNCPLVAAERRYHRERRLLRRLAILFFTLYIVGFPYLVFFCLYKGHVIPFLPYAQRVSYMFITLGQSLTVLISLITTDDIRKSMINMVKQVFRHNQVEQIATITAPTQNRHMHI